MREDPGRLLSVSLGWGDRLYLYTDGLTEAKNRDGEEFGRQRVLTTVEAHGEASLSASLASLMQHLEDWCGSSTLADDISLLAVERSRDGTARRGE